MYTAVKIPPKAFVAFSGGVDSTAVLDYVNSSRDITAAFFHHGTETSAKAVVHVKEYCETHGIRLVIGENKEDKPKDQSWEEFWRIQRYKFFHSLDAPVITAHTLDDCVETWLFTSFHGNPKIIPLSNRNVIRPFLIVRKQVLEEWCAKRGLSFIHDESNDDVRFSRNRIRHNILPEVLHVSPGIHTVILKKIKEAMKLTGVA